MSGFGTVGAVAELWRFPVKSMAGESVSESDVGAAGMRGDRAFALVDCETGNVASAKSARLFPDILECRAAYLEPPRVGQPLPPVRITLPNGATIVGGEDTGGDGAADRLLSSFFRRPVALACSDSDSAAFGPFRPGAFFDLDPMTVITTSTLERLRQLRPQCRFDPARFRMNVVLSTQPDGFIENAWKDRTLSVGESVRLRVTMPDPRCSMTTAAQGDLPKDTDVLRTLAQHNSLDVADMGRLPCAGVYAAVAAAGTIRVGDRAVLTP